MADRLEQWALEQWALAHSAEGEPTSELKGEIPALQRLLSKRFSAIPADTTRLMANVLVEAIECWLDRIIDAQQMTSFFKND